jgi:threonine dehydrogenase-like Zn-dependent dehydrogenase
MHAPGDVTPEIRATGLGGLIDGTLREYMVVPAHVRPAPSCIIAADGVSQSLVAVPAQWSFEEASTLPCAALTAYNALHGPKPVKAGDTVLIIGTGGVSMYVVGVFVPKRTCADVWAQLRTAVRARGGRTGDRPFVLEGENGQGARSRRTPRRQLPRGPELGGGGHEDRGCSPHHVTRCLKR